MSTDENEKLTNEVSKSKQKRDAQKKKAQEHHKKETAGKLVTALIIVIIVAAVAAAVGAVIYKRLQRVTPVEDGQAFSEMLDANGFLSGVKALDYVTLPDYANGEIPYSEIEYTDAQIDENIANALASHKVLSDDTTTPAKEGDTVSIDFVGTIDGAEFAGGSATDYSLTLGSGQFIPGFEEQLIGCKAGDEVEVKVTFPEDYGMDDLNGKEAIFAVTVNGLMTEAEFNDDFVKEFLSAYADSAEGYRTYLREKNERANFEVWAENYLKENVTVNKYPKDYVKYLQRLSRYQDQETYTFMNEFYAQSGNGASNPQSFMEYMGMDEDSYAASLKAQAKDDIKLLLAYQAILEKENVSYTGEEYKAYLTSINDNSYETSIASFGEPYTMQKFMKVKAIQVLRDKMKLN